MQSDTRRKVEETAGQAAQALVEKIAELAPSGQVPATARALRDMAEAFAWIMYPNQPHGGSVEVKTG